MNLRDIHTPVLLERCIELLAPALERDGAVLVDATLGMGGHSEAFLERFPGIHLIGLDRDQDALRIAGERLAPFGDRVTLVHTVYDGIAEAVDLRRASSRPTASSSISASRRCSSTSPTAASRIRRTRRSTCAWTRPPGTTAADILATYGEGDLRRIFERYGEEKLAGRYARAIIAARREAPIERSGRLVEILHAATPVRRAARRAPGQAGLPGAAHRGQPRAVGARARDPRRARACCRSAGASSCCRTSRSRTGSSSASFARATASTAPAGLPVELPEHAPRFRLLVKGAELASDEERARNPRATPVRLRAAERMREAA